MKLLLGDCLEILKTIENNSVDALVTDPPAGISFMGKEWDSAKGGSANWISWFRQVMEECLRVMKPGAHGLVWSIPRTAHWTATACEQAGLEIRDCVTHLFGTGFPKSLDISKAIDKAAGAKGEPYVDTEFVRRNPGKKRDGIDRKKEYSGTEFKEGEIGGTRFLPSTDLAKRYSGWGTSLKPAAEFWWLIRKPISEKTVAANVARWGTGGINIAGCRVGISPSRFPANLVLDEEVDLGAASRFFYVAKASQAERGANNNHPTVKALKLMSYLCRLVTPPGGTVLDPFMGSGSTGLAAKAEGFRFIGIEREQEYFEVAGKRIAAQS